MHPRSYLVDVINVINLTWKTRVRKNELTPRWLIALLKDSPDPVRAISQPCGKPWLPLNSGSSSSIPVHSGRGSWICCSILNFQIQILKLGKISKINLLNWRLFRWTRSSIVISFVSSRLDQSALSLQLFKLLTRQESIVHAVLLAITRRARGAGQGSEI